MMTMHPIYKNLKLTEARMLGDSVDNLLFSNTLNAVTL